MPVQLPHSVVNDSYKAFTSMSRATTARAMTRAGVMLTFDRSAKACQATLQYPLERPIRGGSRIRTDRGEATIIGGCRHPSCYWMGTCGCGTDGVEFGCAVTSLCDGHPTAFAPVWLAFCLSLTLLSRTLFVTRCCAAVVVVV